MFFIVLLLTSLFVEIALFRSIQRLYLVFSTTVRIIIRSHLWRGPKYLARHLEREGCVRSVALYLEREGAEPGYREVRREEGTDRHPQGQRRSKYRAGTLDGTTLGVDY
jgi:hypothetical protein